MKIKVIFTENMQPLNLILTKQIPCFAFRGDEIINDSLEILEMMLFHWLKVL